MPPRLTYPGVYVVEQASGVRTVTGVATSTALMIGMTQKGPLGRPTPVRTADQFDDTFGDSATYGEMAMQVRQFFLNGGSEAIIVRATATGPAGADEAAVTLTSEAGNGASGSEDVLTLTAKDAGTLSNELRAVVDYDTPTPELTFNIEVFRRSIDANGAAVISDNEFFADVSADPNHPRFVSTVLDNQSLLVNATTSGAPVAGERGFSQSGLVLANAAAAADATLSGLVNGGESIRIQVGNGAPVTVQLPPLATINTWLSTLEDDINDTLNANGQAASVAVGTQSFGPGRCIRISSDSADAPESVIITPAASNDATAVLQLGSAAGGIEIGTYSRFRPAPSGYVTRINQAVNNTFGQNNNLTRLISLATVAPGGFTDWAFDPGAGPTLSGVVSFTGAGANLLTGTANSDGEGSLRNTALHLDSVASSLGAGLGTAWSVSRYGYRIALSPNTGNSNFGVDAALSSPSFAGFTGASGAANAAQAANTATYSLGTSGTERRQGNGVLGTDGAAPELDAYQDIFSTVQSEVDLFNIMLLPRGPGQTDADRMTFWGPASAFCREERAILIVDPPSDVGTGWDTVDDVDTGIADLRLGAVTDHAAIYWPRIRVAASPLPIDPSGTVAGIMARTDTRRGVWKAPAGLEATTLGATGFEHLVSDAENGVTNPEAVNTLRQFAAGGVVWGARTMAGFDNSGENDYRYVPVRRTALFIEESLYRGLQFAVFEPNDEPLWAQIRLAAGAFMQNLFRQGAFQGSKASDAYLVRCDETTTTQNDINLGRVNVLVGFAPLRPAEFVVLTVRQLAGQVQT